MKLHLVAVLAATLAAWTGGAALASPMDDAFLEGAAFAKSDLTPLGSGLTALQFVPGKGLVRSAPTAQSGLAASAYDALSPPKGPDRAFATFGRFSRVDDENSAYEVGVAAPLEFSEILDLISGKTHTFIRRPRWFLFAASSSSSVGYEFRQHEEGGWGAAGWTGEKIGYVERAQTQAGVAWRRGMDQADLSYIHKKIQVHVFGQSMSEDRIAITYTRATR